MSERRFRVQDPPLQNIPLRTPLGREIRAALRPEVALPEVDYAELERRVEERLRGGPSGDE